MPVPTEIERLYREHRAGLVRLVERELRDRHEAEDVVQTAFLDAQRALERGTIPRNPRAWLAAIALNAARRLRRRRLNAAPLEEYAVEEASGVSEIRAALTSLPMEQQRAVVYRDVLGFSYGETAEQMGRSVNAVTMLLHRGRRRLRQTLGVTVGGVGVWRWLRQAGTPQVAVVKGAALVAVSAGLATGGVVAAGRAARAAAPARTATIAVQATHAPSLAAGAGQARSVTRARESARRQLKAAAGSPASPAIASTQGATAAETRAAATRAAGRSSTANVVPPPPSPQSTPKLQLPTVSLPTLPTPTLPVTVAATVAVSTPVTTATVSASVGTTVTVATPITTITLPVP